MTNQRRFFIKLRRTWLNVKSFFKDFRNLILQLSSYVIPILLLIGVGLVVYDFGYKPFWSNSRSINIALSILLDILVIIMGVRLLLDFFVKRKLWVRVFTIIGWVFIFFLAIYALPAKSVASNNNEFLFFKIIIYAGIILAFIIEVSYLLQFIYKGKVSPAMLFVSSFALIILIGAFLLKLPNSTHQHLSALDALFTSTSAVCVTGLIVVDTAVHFTTFGKMIIMILIQVGGLGIMTFAGLFAYAVTGGVSLKTQLAFKDVMSGKEIGNIIHFVWQVVIVTFVFEIIGAFFIYFSTPDDLFLRQQDKIFFSIFHSISAFCNAGFSTYTNGLHEQVVRYNYSLHFFIAVLIILGGMGFPIVFNIYKFLQVKSMNLFYFLNKNPKRIYFPRLINLNSRLALVVSGLLLIIGFVSFFIFEQGNTLQDHPTVLGKVVTSFFGSVTPRTAGFNTFDIAAISLPMIMIYLLMMWIGASPGSTGGGIKTTTVGVAFLNAISILRGKDRTEFFYSEVSHNSIRRAFAVIFMSLLFIGVAVFLVSINDSDKGLIKIAFEVFSAFSTVGLSLGVTGDLTPYSKVVIMITMFVGRVGTVTLMVAFIRQTKQLYYRYPKEDITF